MLPFCCVILYTNAMQQSFTSPNTSLSSSPLDLEQRLDVLQLPEATISKPRQSHKEQTKQPTSAQNINELSAHSTLWTTYIMAAMRIITN